MDIERVNIELSRRDWNAIAKVVYRLRGVEDYVWRLFDEEKSPYWLNEALWYYEYLLMHYVGTATLAPVDWSDLESDSAYVDIIAEVCDDFCAKQTKYNSPTVINDGDLEPFVETLYNALTEYCYKIAQESLVKE